MILKRNEELSTNRFNFYFINEKKMIAIRTEPDRQILAVVLADRWHKAEEFYPKGLWYLENITRNDCTELDIDCLMTLIAQEEHGYVRA